METDLVLTCIVRWGIFSTCFLYAFCVAIMLRSFKHLYYLDNSKGTVDRSTADTTSQNDLASIYHRTYVSTRWFVYSAW